MDFLDPKIEAYSSAHTEPESELLADLNRETHLRTTMPRMLSGHLQGRLLSLLSSLVKPSSILEIGTFTGYSTLCLAEGLAPGGMIRTIDSNDETSSIARKYVQHAGLESQIELLHGDARIIIPEMTNQFELVFIDADKENYSVYFDMVIDKMKSGGLIIADNVLWSGKVVNDVKPNDKETMGLMAFTQKVCKDVRVTPLLLPVRDGLLILRVK